MSATAVSVQTMKRFHLIFLITPCPTPWEPKLNTLKKRRCRWKTPKKLHAVDFWQEKATLVRDSLHFKFADGYKNY